MVKLFVIIFLFCLSGQKICCEVTISTSTVTEIDTTSLEEYTPEEEQLLDQAYESWDSVEQETVGTVTDETLPLLQEDEGLLDQLRQSPLDLNTATYLQLKTIPGMTPEIARQIVRTRRTQPFKSKSELKKIRGVTDEVYKRISPYVTVHKVKQPAKLKGQVRLRARMSQPESYEYTTLKTNYVPVEKFKQPLYFYNRTQLSYGEHLSLGYVFLHRPLEIEVNPDTFQYFLRKWWLRLNSIGPFDKILFGNYKAGFGYGVVFHENSAVESLLGSVKPKMHGLREDKSTSDNAYLYGIGVESNFGTVEYAVFYSKKQLILKTEVSTSTMVDENTGEEKIVYTYEPSDELLYIRNLMITFDKYLMDYDVNIVTSTFDRLPTRKVYEELIGASLLVPINILKLGVCGYYTKYNKPFDPDKTKSRGYTLVDKYSERWRYVYRGDNLAVYSLYFEVPIEKITFWGEVGQSQAWFSNTVSTQTVINFQQGLGVNLGISLPVRHGKFYLLYTYLEPTFYSPLSSPVKIYDYYNNQQGVKFVTEYGFGKLGINFYYSVGELFNGIWSGYSTSESPRFPSKYNEIFLETKYKPVKSLELSFRTMDDLRERYIRPQTYGISSQQEYVQTEQLRLRTRYQITCDAAKDVRLRFRYDQRWQSFIRYNKWSYGDQLWAELRYKFWSFTINSRFCIFDTDKDVYLSYLEQQWYNLYMSETENNSSGDKFYITTAYRFSKNKVLWLRYRYKVYSYKSGTPTWWFTSLKDTLGITDHDFRIQLDIGF